MRKPPLSMMMAALPSHLRSSSSSTRSSSRTSSSISWGSVGISCGLAITLVDELVQEQAGDHVQRFEHSLALVGATGEGWHFDVTVVEQEIHVLQGRDIGQVALVVLQHIGNVGQMQ